MEQATKTILGLSLGILVLAGLAWWMSSLPKESQQANLAQGFQGSLSSQELTFDFGQVSMAKGKVSHEFKIKNEGQGPAKIERIYTSCMCTEATLLKDGKEWGPYGMPGHGFVPKVNQIMNPGQEAIIKVVFDPAAHGPAGIGKAVRGVIIENDAGQALELQIEAVVTP